MSTYVSPLPPPAPLFQYNVRTEPEDHRAHRAYTEWKEHYQRYLKECCEENNEAAEENTYSSELGEDDRTTCLQEYKAFILSLAAMTTVSVITIASLLFINLTRVCM